MVVQMLGWDPTTRKGRLTAMAQYLELADRGPSEDALRVRLLEAAGQGLAEDDSDQAGLAKEFKAVLFARPHPVALAWSEYQKLGMRINKIRKALGVPDEETAVEFKGPDVNRLQVFVENFEGAYNLVIRKDLAVRLRVYAAMTGILQVRGMLKEITMESHRILHRKREAEKQKRKLSDDELRLLNEAHDAALHFVNLRWFEQVPVSLGRVRNDWSHGRAAVRDDGLHLINDRNGTTSHMLSLRDLAALLVAGRYAWEASLVEPLWLRSIVAVEPSPSGEG